MSVNGLTGLSLRQEKIAAQKNLSETKEQKNKPGIFMDKKLQQAVLSQKIQDSGIAFKQKTSIFNQLELKANLSGYDVNSKSTEHKIADLNYDFESANLNRLSLQNSAFESAGLKAGLNLKKYELQLAQSNTRSSVLAKKIGELEAKIEEKQNTQKKETVKKQDNAAKNDWITEVDKGKALNADLQVLQKDKFNRASALSALKQKVANNGSQISNLISQKSNMFSLQATLESRKFLIGQDISALQNLIASLKSAAKVSVKTSAGSFDANSTSSIAIDASQTIQGSSAAAAIIAESQKTGDIENEISLKPVADSINTEKIQQIIDAQAGYQIEALEAQLSSKISERATLDEALTSNKSRQEEINSSISESENNEEPLSSVIEEHETEISTIDKQISVKQSEVSSQDVTIKEKEAVLNHSEEVTEPTEEDSELEDLKIELEDLKKQKEKVDKDLKDLKYSEATIAALTEGSPAGETGTKEKVAESERKIAVLFQTLEIKSSCKNDSILTLNFNHELTNRAKSDIYSAKVQLDGYERQKAFIDAIQDILE